MNNNYYLVEVMCGHVGRSAYIPILFPIIAENGKIAAKIARNIPRVKHNNKRAILNVVKVTYEEYVAQQNLNRNDAYLNWHEDGCTEEYTRTVIDRIKFMDNMPFLNRRKKERSKRPVRDFRRCNMQRLCTCDI